MKKYFIVLMVSLLFFGFTGSNSVLADVNTINLAVNGMLVDFPDQKPYIDKNNRTMVPVRFPAETLGANVDWLSNTRQVHIVNKAHDALKDTDIMATIDRKDVIVNGQTKYMDTTAVITNSRTMVPVRFISEYLGAAVTWHDASRAAHVFTKGQTKEEIAKIEEQIAQIIKKQQPQPKPQPIVTPTKPGDKYGTLSTEKIAELKEIPYGTNPNIKMGDLSKEDEKLAREKILEHLTLKPGQSFASSSELVYEDSLSYWVVRGVLTITNSDGTITTENVEASAFNGGSSEQAEYGWHPAIILSIDHEKRFN